jgi:adenosylcobinamide-GDP ribazoletransferase
MALLTKFAALHELTRQAQLSVTVAALVAGHALSRLASTSLLCLLDYVREDELAKSKPLARKLSVGEWLCAAFFGLAPLAALLWLGVDYRKVLVALALAVAVTLGAKRYLERHLGGYTGDCLGATQQLAELGVYIGLLCRFS